MTTRPSLLADLDRQERAALEALGLDPSGIGPSATCPDPATVTAAREGVLPDDLRDAVEAHRSSCPYCQRLAEALGHVYDDAARLPTSAIDQLVFAPLTARPHRWRWVVPFGGLALAASVAWVFLAGVSQVAMPSVPAPPTAWPGPSASLTRSVFLANRPAIPAADVDLVFRGDTTAPQDPADVASQALDLASRGRLEDAIAQLEQASRRHPGSVEVALALGTLLLEKGETARAVTTLEPARRRGSSALREEVEWYLAVGHTRSGRPDQAAALLVPLCEGGGPRSAIACAGLDEIASGRAGR